MLRLAWAKMGVILVGDRDSLLNAIDNNESNRSGIFSFYKCP